MRATLAALLALLALLALAACGRTQSSPVEAPIVADPASPPATVLAAPPSPAARHAKVIVFGAAWAMGSVDLDAAMAADPLKADLAENVDVQRVDCTDDQSPEAAAATKKWSVHGVPTVIVLDPAGREVGRIESASRDDLARLHAFIAGARR